MFLLVLSLIEVKSGDDLWYDTEGLGESPDFLRKEVNDPHNNDHRKSLSGVRVGERSLTGVDLSW